MLAFIEASLIFESFVIFIINFQLPYLRVGLGCCASVKAGHRIACWGIEM